MRVWDVRRAIERLLVRGLLGYRKAFNGRGIRLIDERPASALRLNVAELAARAAAEQRKLRRMIDYCYHTGCLPQLVRGYLCDPNRLERCGTCSNCARADQGRVDQGRVARQAARGAGRRGGGTLSIRSQGAVALPPASELDDFIVKAAPSGKALRERLKSRAEIDSNRLEEEDAPSGADVREDAVREDVVREDRELNAEQTLVVRKVLSCVARM